MSLTYPEALARGALLSVASYEIELDVTSRDTFGCRTTVRFSVSEPGSSTFLELTAARGLSVTVDGAPVPAAYDGQRITLDDLSGETVVVVDARLPYVNDGDGMHTFTDPADGETYVSAYVGMDLARRVFACFDQPDLKAPITLGVLAPESWKVIANGRQTGDPVAVPTGRHHSFTTTPPISTYLVTVCAGPWASITWEHAGLPFGWHARASLAQELDRDAEDLRTLTNGCFDFYTDAFDEAYPFDSYDQMLVPGLNWGAMESPGCVTFRDELLPRHEPDAGDLVDRSTVVAHEMAHMWFGDLVTMKWWQDSWLNESFADFMGYEVADRAGVTGAWPDFALNRKPSGFEADARRSTHPIAEDAANLVDVDTAFNNFDMITYAKGASVLHQLVTWLGWETFVAGTNVYLTRHRFGNAELADYLDALDSVTDRDVRRWAELYLRTTGFDTITVERDGEVPVLVGEGTRPHRLSVAAWSGAEVTGVEPVDLDREPVALEAFAGRPVVPDAADQAHAEIHLDDLSWAAVRSDLSALPGPLLRAVTWSNAMTRVAVGTTPVTELLALAEAHLGLEPDPIVFGSMVRRLSERVVQTWIAPEDLPHADGMLASACAQALAEGDTERGLAAMWGLSRHSVDVDLLQRWLADGRTDHGLHVDRDTRWLVVRRLVELGAADEALVAREADADRTAGGHEASLAATAACPAPEAKAASWSHLIDPTTSNRDFEAVAAGFWTAGQEELVAPYLQRYLADGPAVASRSQGFAQTYARAVPRMPLSLTRLEDFHSALADAIDRATDPVLTRGWNDRLDDLDVVLRIRRGS